MNIGYTKEVDLKTYLNDQFIKWRGTSKTPIIEFARYLEVKQVTFDSWINRGSIPKRDAIDKIAKKLGDGIYFVLDILPPSVNDKLSFLSPDERALVFSATIEAISRISSKGIDFNSLSDNDKSVVLNSILDERGSKFK